MKRLIAFCCRIITTFAFTVTAINVNTTCYFVAFQPELPKGSEKLKNNENI